ncbi:MAG: Ig-like domain-containing protein, partial [Nitrospirae bacterium]|nr:Ig-like domain-containing protein [Nitrospirota bacterium]
GQRALRLFARILPVFLLLSCSKAKEEKAPQAGPQKTSLYKIELLPVGATKNDTISVKVKGVSPSDLRYQWIVNGREIEDAREASFKYPELKKNDTVEVKVSIKGTEYISDPIIIANIYPEIKSAKLLPQNPKKGAELRVEAITEDRDGDPVTLTYEWFINGEAMLGETSDTLKAEFKRGDKVSVRVASFDGQHQGQAMTLSSVIANSPPKVSPDVDTKIEGDICTAKIKATDPDGDALTYSIKEGPQGMTIDQSGIITWKVRPEEIGENNITVSVKDGSGGETVVPLTIKLGL